MNIEEMRAECEQIAILQADIKHKAMFYQYNLKIKVAEDLGLTFEDVNLPYDEWAAIRNPWLEKQVNNSEPPQLG